MICVSICHIPVIATNDKKITHGLLDKSYDINDAITNDLVDGKQAGTLRIKDNKLPNNEEFK